MSARTEPAAGRITWTELPTARTADVLLALCLGAGLVTIAFLTTGGTDLAPNTWVEIALTVLGTGLACAVALLRGARRFRGAATLLLFAALAVLTYASIAWSVVPDTSWVEANRTLSYLATFAGAMALARVAPRRLPAVAGAVALAAAAICGYALATKVFPASLDPTEMVGRLRAPFGYYNAIGLMGALGIAPCLWLGARREGGRILRVLCVPAIALLVVAIALSYSRGAVLAGLAGLACWFALAPVRLRSALLLAPALVGAAVASAWALSRHAITADRVPLALRTSAGHSFGLVLVAMVVVLALAGVAAAITMERAALGSSARRRAGAALLACVALVPAAGVVAVAGSSRGLSGEVSHLYKEATNPNGGAANDPARLGELGSSRPGYWRDGLRIGEHALLAGVGARGYATARERYAPATPFPSHPDAHSYVIETFADFGLIGVALSLALLVAWLALVRRAIPSTDVPEQAGLVALLAVAVAFGVHSTIDWTWFIPGVALPALLCAGWLAGRAQPAEPVDHGSAISFSPGRAALAVGLAALALSGAWAIWQPLRSADADASAIAELVRHNGAAALTDARRAVSSDPVSLQALWTLGELYSAIGDQPDAHREFMKATSVQPANPASWQRLGEYDIGDGRLSEAVRALRRALALEPGWTVVAEELASARAALASHGGG